MYINNPPQSIFGDTRGSGHLKGIPTVAHFCDNVVYTIEVFSHKLPDTRVVLDDRGSTCGIEILDKGTVDWNVTNIQNSNMRNFWL
jgi:hypothetical protein